MFSKKLTAKKVEQLKHVVVVYAFILVIWGFYRSLLRYPEVIEEVLIKPIVWLPPLIWALKKEGKGIKSLGFVFENSLTAIYFALALGSLFALEGLFANFIKHGEFLFEANVGEGVFVYSFALSFITATLEEATFRGYFFGRIWDATGNEWLANAISTAMWTVIHIPIAIFIWELPASSLFSYSLLTISFGIGAAFLFARSKNIISPILLHILWQWPIILFR